MKSINLLNCTLLLLICLSLATCQARVFFASNGGILCVWSSKRSCNKATPVCIELSGTCKLYRNECKYIADMCLSKTAFGSGTTADLTKCSGLKYGFTQAC